MLVTKKLATKASSNYTGWHKTSSNYRSDWKVGTNFCVAQCLHKTPTSNQFSVAFGKIHQRWNRPNLDRSIHGSRHRLGRFTARVGFFPICFMKKKVFFREMTHFMYLYVVHAKKDEKNTDPLRACSEAPFQAWSILKQRGAVKLWLWVTFRSSFVALLSRPPWPDVLSTVWWIRSHELLLFGTLLGYWIWCARRRRCVKQSCSLGCRVSICQRWMPCSHFVCSVS